MNRFEQAVAGVLEADGVTPETRFRATDGWCSLLGFGLLVLLENDWDTPLDVNRFRVLETVRDLQREAFLSFAARILGVGRTKLSGGTAYGSIPEWDSVNHLRLVMETEAKFGVYYPLERIPALRTLDDFLSAADAPSGT